MRVLGRWGRRDTGYGASDVRGKPDFGMYGAGGGHLGWDRFESRDRVWVAGVYEGCQPELGGPARFFVVLNWTEAGTGAA